MSEPLRALIVIIPLIIVVLFIYRSLALELNIYQSCKKWVLIFSLITIFAFASGDYFLFVTIASVIILMMVGRNKEEKIAIFFVLVIALPRLSYEIPGFGFIDHILIINYPRLLIILILIPLIFVYRHKIFSKTDKSLVDHFVLLFFIYITLLDYRGVSFTEGSRQALINFIDIYVPYIVVSRLVDNEEAVKKILFGILVGATIMSFIGLFETFKSWLLYDAMQYALQVREKVEVSNIASYKYRGGMLRAVAAHGSVHLSFLMVMMVASVIYFYHDKKNDFIFYLLLLVAVGCSLVTFTRSGWTALIVYSLVYSFLTKNMIKTLLIGVALLFTLYVFSLLDNRVSRIVEMVPIIGGGIGKETVDYREKLFSTGIEVANENIIFGDFNYLNNSKMQILIQGEQIIDVVNTYLHILLEYGYLGLLIFLLMMISGISMLLLSLRNEKHLKHDSQLGISLIAMFVSLCMMLFATSSFESSVLFNFTWLLLALLVAISRLLRTNT
jgi:hypothetical protein